MWQDMTPTLFFIHDFYVINKSVPSRAGRIVSFSSYRHMDDIFGRPRTFAAKCIYWSDTVILNRRDKKKQYPITATHTYTKYFCDAPVTRFEPLHILNLSILSLTRGVLSGKKKFMIVNLMLWHHFEVFLYIINSYGISNRIKPYHLVLLLTSDFFFIIMDLLSVFQWWSQTKANSYTKFETIHKETLGIRISIWYVLYNDIVFLVPFR